MEFLDTNRNLNIHGQRVEDIGCPLLLIDVVGKTRNISRRSVLRLVGQWPVPRRRVLDDGGTYGAKMLSLWWEANS
jgi:hypothetical protein